MDLLTLDIDLVDLEALFVRQRAVHKLMRRNQIKADEALTMIIWPPPEVLEASLVEARRTGIRKETLRFLRSVMDEKRPRTGPGPLADDLDLDASGSRTVDRVLSSVG